MKRIRVLIADDSSLARSLLRGILEDEADIEVVGEAGNGREAVDLARELKPDLITMDIEMPVMNGLDAIEEIMCSKAIPILVVSSVADAVNALDAVGRGALEVVGKPDYSPEEAASFVARVRLLAGVMVITRMRPRKSVLAAPPLTPSPAAFPRLSDSGEYARVFAIACSTGGPQALAQILPALPEDFPCPVVIAQHISDGFAGGMAEWMARLCKLPVRLAADGDRLQAGVIHISPSEQHCSVVPTRRIAFVNRSERDIYHPSCDVLLASVAEVFGPQAVGIILTGMGRDGARGISRIRAMGGLTLGQDEGSSVVYGMNRVAIETGDVQQVLPLSAIADEMVRLAVGNAK
ncbi:MAG: chemotaxis-specific protein-glutamate methyltransferase CheB [Actinomycetota bacterium]|nr:chemotaxis-specific protein-glutamate methyltransferase CheB [Actinomycetota bacterium]